MTLAERFFAKVKLAAPDDLSPNGMAGCWLWTASLGTHGYGQISRDGRPIAAHRVAFELVGGWVPNRHELDHLCRRRHCVNPMHLEPVIRAVNNQRGNLAKLTAEQVVEICARRARGETLQSIADRFGVSNQRVHEIVRGEGWQNVERAA
jgi:hypothetical protein